MVGTLTIIKPTAPGRMQQKKTIDIMIAVMPLAEGPAEAASSESDGT